MVQVTWQQDLSNAILSLGDKVPIFGRFHDLCCSSQNIFMNRGTDAVSDAEIIETKLEPSSEVTIIFRILTVYRYRSLRQITRCFAITL